MPERILFKRYPNRRLYNTDTSSYVTLDGVANVIRKGERVEVVDAGTGEDITSYVLTQVLLEEARKKSFLLPPPLLHLAIRHGDGALADFFGTHLHEIVKNYLSFQSMVGDQFRRWMTAGLDVSGPGGGSRAEGNPILAYLERLMAPPGGKEDGK